MRIIAVLISIMLAFCGCGKEYKAVNTESFHIVTSFYPMYILTKNIVSGADNVTLTNMSAKHTGCLHEYTLLPQDMRVLEDADILIINGGGLESFMDKISQQKQSLTIIDASKNITLINNNPHIWVSINGAMAQADNITEKLAEYDAKNAEIYKKNNTAFKKKLNAQFEKMEAALRPYKGEPIATFHEAFDYFAADFGLKISAVVEAEPDHEPTPGQLASTIDIIKKTNTKALFDEPNSTSDAPKTIAAATGLKLHVLNPVTSGDDDADAYLRIMDENLKALLEGLQ